nr:unnamed protein product [Callosobruchus analis]
MKKCNINHYNVFSEKRHL